jgi:hypothetical protein
MAEQQHDHLQRVESICVREGSASLIFRRYCGSFCEERREEKGGEGRRKKGGAGRREEQGEGRRR